VLMAQSRFKSAKELKGMTIAVSNFVGPLFRSADDSQAVWP